MPTLASIPLYVLLIANTLLLYLLVRRRHETEAAEAVSAEQSGGTDPAAGAQAAVDGGSDSENRLLRLQVETLTEALEEASTKPRGSGRKGAGRRAKVETKADKAGKAAPRSRRKRAAEPSPEAPAPEQAPAQPASEPVSQPVPQPVSQPVGEPVVAHPGAKPVVPETPVVEPAASIIEPVEVPEPVAQPVAQPAPVRLDGVADAYAALSRTFAGSGRLREAALAQWAADLRRLAPLLVGHEQELYDGLRKLAPADVAGAVTAARAVAASLAGPTVDITPVLADATHLTARSAPGTAAPSAPDVSPEVLPDAVAWALESALVDSAERAEDTARLSVGLRCDLVAQVLPHRHGDDAAAVVRDVLEPHERPAYDAVLAERAS